MNCSCYEWRSAAGGDSDAAATLEIPERIDKMAISLESSAPTLSQDEKSRLDQLISEVATIKDQMSKVAVVLKRLSEGMAEQRSKAEPQLSEITPTLEAMKVHVDSFPHALREARRSDVATQKAVEKLAARVAEIESKLGTICTPAGPSDEQR